MPPAPASAALSSPRTPRPATPLVARRGVEVAAAVLARSFDRVAVIDGDGAALVADALAAEDDARAGLLPTRGLDAAWAAFGHAAAGEHVALVASGRDTVSALVPLVREAARLGVGITLVLPAHGDASGRAVPGGPCDDLALACDLPLGVLVAGAVAEVADLTLTALAFARLSAWPWCVGFELARVGFAAAAVSLPDATACARWRPPPGPRRALDDLWRFARERAPHLAAVAVRGDGDGVSAGLPFAARGIGLRQLRPFPAADLAAAVRGPVRAFEAWPDPLGPGRLTRALRLALGATAAVTETSPGDESPARIAICVDEPRRDALLREALATLARWGVSAEAACHEPWVATLRLATPGLAPPRAVLCEPAALGLSSVLADLAPGTPVVAVGPGDPAALIACCEDRGALLHHAPDAQLTPTEAMD